VSDRHDQNRQPDRPDLERIPLFDDEPANDQHAGNHPQPPAPGPAGERRGPDGWRRLAAAPEPIRKGPNPDPANTPTSPPPPPAPVNPVTRGPRPAGPGPVDDQELTRPRPIYPVAQQGSGASVTRLPNSSTTPGATDMPAGIVGTGEVGVRFGGYTEARPSTVGSSVLDPGVDWDQVQEIRTIAGVRLSGETEGREGIDEETRRELARKIIIELVAEVARDADLAGTGGLDPEAQQRLVTAVFESQFGLGRLQPLVDDEEIENIEIRGYDDVLLIYNDGRIVKGPPVAASNEQLIRDLQFYAARNGSERPFSPAHPNLDLKLPGNHRLSANAWISPEPYVVIRRHRLVDIDLQDLVNRDMLSTVAAQFLDACVRAKLSVVVSGPQGAGKTTLVRALANSIPPWESIATIETEYELLIHEMQQRHPRCFAFEARPGSGERDANGRRLGEVTLDDIMYAVLRKNLSRIIVGEVRGLEVIPMLEAMQAGSGSLSTTHANNAKAAVHRLAGLALKGGSHLREFALTQIAEHIDIIVQIRLEDTTTAKHDATLEDFSTEGAVVGHRRRFVSEIVLVEPGEDGHPAFTDVFVPADGGQAAPGLLPSSLATQLAPFGFVGHGFTIGRDH